MTTNKARPCYMCPCKPTTPKLHRDMIRSRDAEVQRSGGFPCHELHPTEHALADDAALDADGRYKHTDCAGYKLWGLDLTEQQ